jgi:hypothetical protein
MGSKVAVAGALLLCLAGREPLFASPVTAADDSAAEVVLSPSSPLPLYGPRYAAVTVDLFLPFGQRLTAPNLALLLRVAGQAHDIRLLFHPVLGSEAAERGAEALFSVWQELRGADAGPQAAQSRSRAHRSFAFAAALATHPDWLEATAEAERALQSGVEQLDLGIDSGRLLRELRLRTQRTLVAGLWQRERGEVRSPPEVWLNGHRLRGPLSESQLSEELSRQRSRSYQALRSGTPLSRIYEQQLARERSDQAASTSWLERMSKNPATAGTATPANSPVGWAVGLPPAPSENPPLTRPLLHFAFPGAPSRGPEISPATLVLMGSLDTYGTYLQARIVSASWARRRETVRLVFQHAPTTENSRRVALLLAQVGLVNPAAFWRAFDGILELMNRRFLLRYSDVVELLSHQGVAVAQLEETLRDPQRSLAARSLVAHDLELAQRLSFPAMSQLLLNGRPLPNVQSAAELDRLVETELGAGMLSRWLKVKR